MKLTPDQLLATRALQPKPLRIFPEAFKNELGLDNDLLTQASKQLADDFIDKHDAIVLSALRKYLPDISKENAASYAGRISRIRLWNKAYPEQYWLDKGTPDEVLFLTMYEPQLSTEPDSVAYRQDYVAH